MNGRPYNGFRLTDINYAKSAHEPTHPRSLDLALIFNSNNFKHAIYADGQTHRQNGSTLPDVLPMWRIRFRDGWTSASPSAPCIIMAGFPSTANVTNALQ